MKELASEFDEEVQKWAKKKGREIKAKALLACLGKIDIL